MLVGSVVFSDPKGYSQENHNSGFRALPGDQPKPVAGIGELPTDILWLSNLPYLIVHNTQLAHSPRLLPDKFLRSQVSSILLENGLSNAPIEQRVTFLAELFSNVMRLASVAFDIKYPSNTSLAACIAAKAKYRHEVLTGDLKLAAEEAHQTYVVCERPVSAKAGTKFYSAILPRDAHCQALVEALPVGSFMKIPGPKMPLKSNRVQYLKGSKPCLCRIKLTRITEGINPLLNWGAGAGTNSTGEKSRRSWAMSNEVLFLAEHCEIEIEEIYESVSDLRTEVIDMPLSQCPESSLSNAYGLLCENLWFSLVTNEKGLARKNPLSAWIHAHDRILCMKKAMIFKKRGYAVQGFGYGRITVAVEKGKESEFVRDCYDIGMIAPAGVMNEKVDVQPKTAFDVLWLVNAISRTDMLTILDKKLIRAMDKGEIDGSI